jgi:hypothetical protein
MLRHAAGSRQRWLPPCEKRLPGPLIDSTCFSEDLDLKAAELFLPLTSEKSLESSWFSGKIRRQSDLISPVLPKLLAQNLVARPAVLDDF